MKHLRWCSSSVLAALVLVLGWAPVAESQTKRPIKVGVVDPFSGPLAPIGEAAKVGREVALEEAGYQVAGRKIELIYQDDEGRPDSALTKTQRLIGQDRVDILLGPVSGASALAMRGYVASQGTPWLVTIAGVRDLLGSSAPNLFRASLDQGQHQYPMGSYARKKLGFNTVIIVGLDYVAGRGESGFFIEGFEAAGGKVIQRVFFPLGTADPSPFVAALQTDKADALNLAGVWGADAIRFIRAMNDFGIKSRLPVIAINAAVTDGLLPAIGDAALDIVSYGPYSYGIETSENRRFVDAVWKKGNRPTDQDVYMGYIQGKAMIEALKAVGGDVEDKARYLTALRKLDFVGPAGRFRFDDKQNAVINIYVQKVQRAAGRLHNRVLDVIPEVRAR